MKRYQIVNFDFDNRPYFLNQGMQDTWDEKTKEMWRKQKEDLMNSLLLEFGQYNNKMKLKNFLDLGPAPFSILAFHNNFLRQIRNSFVIGSYYPALTGACCLGERILNHLFLLLRDNFKASDEYKKYYRKEKLDDWDILIRTLNSWGILLDEVIKDYQLLKQLRNKSVHFTKETDERDREDSLEAIRFLSNIIQLQFGAFGQVPWLMVASGGVFIKKQYETSPFIKAIYLANCQIREIENFEGEDSDQNFMDFLEGRKIVI